MRINVEMQVILNELRDVEGRSVTKLIDLGPNDLGNELIKLYYARESLQTRELIRTFLDKAGIVWLRKLLTRDLNPVVSSERRFASLDEYIGLLAANDDAVGLISNG